MKYVVDLNGKRHEVEITGGTAELNGETVAAHLEDIEGTPVRLVTIGREGEALDDRTRAIRDITAASAKPSGPAPVNAPMPGLVVRINVAVGDRVQAGQGVVVMEAMKMENELRASAAGIVKMVHAEVGKAVEKGTVLVELEELHD
jgi:biotin carboxyl carrier protein